MFIRLTHLHIVDRAPVRLGVCWDLWVSLQACGEAHQQAGGVCVAQSNERHCWPDDASPDDGPKFLVFTEKVVSAAACPVAAAPLD
jgi:hypothetical protein